ncbi:hypothetical protein IscW_ISCW011246, partial [Ixodes scapularis]
ESRPSERRGSHPPPSRPPSARTCFSEASTPSSVSSVTEQRPRNPPLRAALGAATTDDDGTGSGRAARLPLSVSRVASAASAEVGGRGGSEACACPDGMRTGVNGTLLAAPALLPVEGGPSPLHLLSTSAAATLGLVLNAYILTVLLPLARVCPYTYRAARCVCVAQCAGNGPLELGYALSYVWLALVFPASLIAASNLQVLLIARTHRHRIVAAIYEICHVYDTVLIDQSY